MLCQAFVSIEVNDETMADLTYHFLVLFSEQASETAI